MRKQFLILSFLFCNIFVYAQGPTAPEAASFEPIDASDMVNLLTGDFTYVMPLVHIPGPEGGYPLTLSYHGGIAVGQEASWTGLGWNVNPGAINRNVSGTPDDWFNTKKYSVIYDKGGVQRSYNIGVSVGWGKNGMFSAGVFASYAVNKSFGGENSYDFNAGVNGGIKLGGAGRTLGLNGSLSLQGVSASTTYNNKSGASSIGLSVSQNFKNGGTSFGLNGSTRSARSISSGSSGSASASLGMSINTRGGGGVTLGNSITGSNSIGIGSPTSAATYSQSSFDLDIPITLPGNINIDIGFSRTRYWLFDTDYKLHNGALYAGKMNDVLSNTPLDIKASFDSYEETSGLNPKRKLDNTNFGFVGYDSYSVTGQGLSGSIEPKILEEGILRTERVSINELTAAYYNYPDNLGDNGTFTNSLDNGKLHFYFTQDNASFLEVNSNNWNTPNSATSYNDIYEFDTSNQNIEANTTIDGELVNGFNSQTNRLRKGSFIETFTNNEIRNSLNQGNPLNFIEAHGINRADEVYSDYGIGGYRITTADGRVYHYSLPVYQKEQFSRSTARNKNPNLEFFEQSQLDAFATHWLLTAITGPDYVDVNNNSIVDEADFGYWVDFEYGKWSDGYAWRTPTVTGFEETPSSISHQWGYKEIYYLDKIKTKTHTALFVKEVREDNRSSIVTIGSSNSPKVYDKNGTRNSILGDDGNFYMQGLYGDLNIGGVSQAANSYGVFKHRVYLNSYPHRTLKLNKIILVNNENISKSNSSESLPILASEIKIDQEWKVFNSAAQLTHDSSENVHDESWMGEFFANVLDEGDITQNAPNIESEALQVINFGYDYELVPSTPNSTAPNGGKLTLKSLSFNGKGNTSLMPPYNFTYFNGSEPYNNENKDDWGYGNQINAWNLSQIKTPLGERLQMTYEEDEFHKEAAVTKLIFDGGKFDMKFTGTSLGNKFVTFRNHVHNENDEDINFTHYFDVGESHNIDVQYYWTPGFSGGDRIADVAALCQVTGVSNGSVTFQLPSSSSNTGVRNGGSCDYDSWIYYENYNNGDNGVVGRTSNFIDDHNSQSCSNLSSGQSRSKIRFFSNNPILDKKGGGLRVREIRLVDGENNAYSSLYTYNNPNSNVSSGITSFEPSKRNKDVSYATQMPSPTVMYEYVTLEKKDSYNQVYSKEIYNFKVLESIQLTNTGFNMGDVLSLERSQDSEHFNIDVDNSNYYLKLAKYNLKDQTSSIGSLLNKTIFNKENQVISRTENQYLTSDNIKQGLTKETYKSYKQVKNNGNDKYYLSSSSKTTYPNILKRIVTTEGNLVSSSTIDKLDFVTGIPIENTSISSDGTVFKTVVKPAYTIPEYTSGNYSMGSKVDNVTNKNMLTQEAANYSYFLDNNGNEKLVAVGLMTWNNDWTYRSISGMSDTPTNGYEKIWRKHRDYTWNGQLETDGSYSNYVGDFDNFNWTVNASENTQPDQWRKTSETTLYNHSSVPLEIVDINGNYASTKTDQKFENILSTANAGYTEQYYSGAEDGVNGWSSGEVNLWNVKQDFAHTGLYSEKSAPSAQSFKCSIIPMLENGESQKDFRVSVWAKKDNYTNARLYNGNSLVEFNGERVFAGDWVQLNAYIYGVNVLKNIYVTSANGTIYFDDFRVYPIQSSMNSYVYNEWNELTDILGANNMATHFEYDADGRLLRTYSEVSDTQSFSGGAKLAAEYELNYARLTEEEESEMSVSIDITYLDNSIYFIPNSTSTSSPQGNVHFTGTAQGVTGGSGNYSYVWDFQVQGGSFVYLTSTSSSSLNLISDNFNATVCGQQVKLRCTVIDQSQSGVQESIEGNYEYLNCNL